MLSRRQWVDELKDRRDRSMRVARRWADSSSTIIWELDAVNRFIYLDAESMASLDSASEMHMSDWGRCIHPKDYPEALRIISQARRRREKYRTEYRVIRSDGTTRWVLSTAAPRFSGDGEFIGYVGTFVDITDHYESRAELLRKETEHRLITEHAGDLVSYIDARNCYQYVSPSHKDILGYEPAELIGTRVFDLFNSEDLAVARQEQDSAHGYRLRLTNMRARHKSGKWIWLSASTRNIFDPHTNAKIGTVAIARDITTQIEIARDMARSEERFRSLTTLSADWYWETDAQRRFTFLSNGIQLRLGVPPSKCIGLDLLETSHDPNDPGFIECMASMAACNPFRDLVYSVSLASYPGVVRFIRMSGEPVFEEGVFRGYRGVTRDVTKGVKSAQAMERLATLDALTGLPNRAVLESRLNQRIQHHPDDNSVHAVLFIDLDGFKEVNDSMGHKAGDILLEEIARRFRACLRPGDIVARMGGDEFVVVVQCEHGSRSAKRVAEKLGEALVAPFMLGKQEVKAGASIGISMYPQDGKTCETLLQNADIALYRAKANGRHTYCFFTMEMGIASKVRLRLQTDLRHALQRNELEVYYQPRVDLGTMEVTGTEALLRWHHPQLGMVPPAQFIPMAEESGLINEIGEWVLQQATRQTREWSQQYRRLLRVSVNLSANQLRDKRIVMSVARALNVSHLPADQLELELTESALIQDPAMSEAVLKEVKAYGLRLSVDDFGTGYSSLAYLRRFPLNSIKLDRSFLLQDRASNVNPLKLAEAIIDLAHTLNLSVVAEGVEVPDHLDFLRSIACDEIQGFCISRPLPPDEFEKLYESLLAAPLHRQDSMNAA